MKDAERTSQVVFTAEPGSPQATILEDRADDNDADTDESGSSFAGQFVGNGAAAIGTWGINASTDDAENLTAAFGAEKGDDVPETAPTVSGGGIAMTSLTDGSAVNAKTGVITIVPAAPNDDPPVKAVTVKGADLFDTGGAVMDGDAFVASAIEEINSLLERLNAFIALDELEDETSADAGRTAVWTALGVAINMVVGEDGAQIFNDDGYSQANNDDDDSDRDAAAKDIIADVLDALSSKTAFRAAVKEDGALYGDSGIVSGGNPVLDAIFARVASKTTIEYGSTTYTRFGAWNRVASTDATVEPVAATPADGRFAYSPLAATAYAVNDPNFPLGGKATYEGSTIARSTTAGDRINTYYEGSIKIDVTWGTDLGTAGQAQDVGTVNASVSNLRDSKGVLYVSGRDANDDTVPGNNVETILFTADNINVARAADGNTLSFGVTSSAVRVRHTDIRQPDLPSNDGAIAGQFVGKVIDGPLGVIGTWGVSGVTGGDDLVGVYGADLAP